MSKKLYIIKTIIFLIIKWGITMISYGEGYKPLPYFKKNLKNLSKSGTLVSVDEEYVKQRSKKAKKITMEEFDKYFKD